MSILVNGISYDTDTIDGAQAQGILIAARTRQLVAISAGVSTTAYTSGDAIGSTAYSFLNAARYAGGGGRIVGAHIYDSVPVGVACRLLLFSALPTSPQTDNAAFLMSDADGLLYQCAIDFDNTRAITSGTTSITRRATTSLEEMPYLCAATTLFGILVATGTPTLAGIAPDGLRVNLFVEQN